MLPPTSATPALAKRLPVDRMTRLERLARWYAEAIQSLDAAERQMDEVLLRLGLAPAGEDATLPTPAANAA